MTPVVVMWIVWLCEIEWHGWLVRDDQYLLTHIFCIKIVVLYYFLLFSHPVLLFIYLFMTFNIDLISDCFISIVLILLIYVQYSMYSWTMLVLFFLFNLIIIIIFIFILIIVIIMSLAWLYVCYFWIRTGRMEFFYDVK